MKLSVIIPVYNEANTIETIVDRVRAVKIDKEIILVDDGSRDNSREILREIAQKYPDTTVILHEENKGKGAALRTGFKAASGDYVIVQDADLEYDPSDYLKLLDAVEKGAVVVYGSRFAAKRKRDLYQTGNMHLLHLLGNRVLTTITNILYGSNLTDMETCYKLIPREVIQSINIRSDRFNFEPEITAKILKKGIKIKEVPITYVGREIHEGKNISWRDGFPAIKALIKYRFIDD